MALKIRPINFGNMSGGVSFRDSGSPATRRVPVLLTHGRTHR
ncbi:hypothetical protein QZM46_29785 [Burkholderia vietnamiensis]|jgi:hypothetical protein|uniref:Uncharacterized protein n=1 Tax=Burkholderia vietnamiensis TaxID=60552 RepID=A0AAW7SUY2_BURVI|nr:MULTISPECIES: hypothetical protein [Burkholderia]AJY03225.1 hypothetical protein AK36_4746 [Burkholderia vietnamiensis LMG 10929]MDN7409669.1 hypothetical protein [Burkholderia vietnamiensis]MDN7555506.1 hypothetical protein [Burkholderia vietnamiensis]MDN7670030.1 hypothetical protein [Burkholderia vietnamiensis]MDN7793687.1 hypothetical protein [Burkholderia vietnamiensis]